MGNKTTNTKSNFGKMGWVMIIYLGIILYICPVLTGDGFNTLIPQFAQHGMNPTEMLSFVDGRSMDRDLRGLPVRIPHPKVWPQKRHHYQYDPHRRAGDRLGPHHHDRAVGRGPLPDADLRADRFGQLRHEPGGLLVPHPEGSRAGVGDHGLQPRFRYLYLSAHLPVQDLRRSLRRPDRIWRGGHRICHRGAPDHSGYPGGAGSHAGQPSHDPEELEASKAKFENATPTKVTVLLRKKELWLDAIIFGLLGMVTAGLVSQMVPGLTSMGIEEDRATLLFSATAFIGLVGSYLWGWLDQKLGTRMATFWSGSPMAWARSCWCWCSR